MLAWFQNKLIFPGHQTQGSRNAEVVPTENAELITLTTRSGYRIKALFGEALLTDGSPLSDPRNRPTVIYFYGNAMCLRDTTFYEFDHFRRLGANVLIPEYVGYGVSEGKPSESGVYETALSAYDYLLTRKDVSPRTIFAAGWSLGGAVATELAIQRPVAGLVVFSTFTSLREMAHRAFPYLPTSLLLRYRFETREKFSRIGCPILIGHSRTDEVVPFEMSGELAAAAKGPVTRVIVERAEHGAFFERGGEKVFTAFQHFLEGISAKESR